MSFLLKLTYSIFTSFWRRWFGGGYIGGKSKEESWYNVRFFQHFVAFLVGIIAIYFLNRKDHLLYFIGDLVPSSFNSYLSYIIPFYIMIIIQGLYWARAHGPAFDISRDKNPSPEVIKRYQKEWWNKICEYLVPVEYWYSYGYDMLWMGFRYTACLILLIPIYGFSILFLGISVPFIYSFCWSFWEQNEDLFNNKVFNHLQIDGPTSFAEYLVGFITGLFIIFL